MKFQAYSLILGIAALSVTSLAAPPSLYKRVIAGSKLIRCTANMLRDKQIKGDCEDLAKDNAGFILGIELPYLNLNFMNPNSGLITLSSTSLSANLITIPGITLPVLSSSQD
ncbi:hypothetical protein BGZ76_005803, partial [Entomortierella beljakovae]